MRFFRQRNLRPRSARNTKRNVDCCVTVLIRHGRRFKPALNNSVICCEPDQAGPPYGEPQKRRDRAVRSSGELFTAKGVCNDGSSVRSPKMSSRLRIKQVLVVAGILCLLALLIGTAAIYWRLRQRDEALRPTTAKLESLQAVANAAQSKADQLHEYLLPDELTSALAQPNNFRVYRTLANIPDSVRSAFAKAADENSFLMADPNGRWESTDVIRDPQLPRRRLSVCGR